jgi:hypothetical protein
VNLRAWAEGWVRDSASGLTLACGAPRSGKTTAAIWLMHWWQHLAAPDARVLVIDPAYELRPKARIPRLHFATEVPDWKSGRPPRDLPPGSLVIIDELAQWMEDPEARLAVRTACRLRGPWKVHIFATTQRPVECAWVLGTAEWVFVYHLVNQWDRRAIERNTGIPADEVAALQQYECIPARRFVQRAT